VVINVFEAVDVIALITGSGDYENLQLSVGNALLRRNEDFAGIHTCSLYDRLSAIFDTIRKSRVHRFIVLDSKGRLQGILTLSDIMEYILLEGETERPNVPS
jgi:5'-AMP-activated protein kinase, regulatory gamma subunit